MSYAGQLLGPTLVVAPGDTIQHRAEEPLDEETNFHTHGLHVSPEGDLRQRAAGDGARTATTPSRSSCPEDVAPGTYWYHAHLHGLTEPQVFSGLAGALVVDGLTERLPADAAGRARAPHRAQGPPARRRRTRILTENIDSNAPTTRTVNGLVNPVLDRAARRDPAAAAREHERRHLVPPEDGRARSSPCSPRTRNPVVGRDPGRRAAAAAGQALRRAGPLGRGRDLPAADAASTRPGPSGDDYPERVLATVTVAGDRSRRSAVPTTMGAAPRPRSDAEVAERARRRSSARTRGRTSSSSTASSSTWTRSMYTPQLGTVEEWTITQHRRRGAPVPHPRERLPGDVGQRRAATGHGLQDMVRLPAEGARW